MAVDFLQHVTTFVRIADAGSISKAARALRLSVAMASRHLRALEQDLGVTLVRRTTRRLTLTDAGSLFLSRSRNLLTQVSEAREAVRPGTVAAGLVVISLPVTFGFAQVSPLFPKLLEQYPQLKLDLRFEDRVIDLLGEGVDIAIRAGVQLPDSPFLLARKLATVERALFASPAYLKKYGPIRTVEALAGLPCVVQGAAPTQWSFETPTGPQMVVVDGRVRSNNVFAIRDAVLAGAGVGRLPSWIVTEDLREKRLVRVLESAVMPTVDVFGLVHRGAQGSSAIKTVLDFLANELPRRTKTRRG